MGNFMPRIGGLAEGKFYPRFLWIKLWNTCFSRANSGGFLPFEAFCLKKQQFYNSHILQLVNLKQVKRNDVF
jgi:hypothetical protein